MAPHEPPMNPKRKFSLRNASRAFKDDVNGYIDTVNKSSGIEKGILIATGTLPIIAAVCIITSFICATAQQHDNNTRAPTDTTPKTKNVISANSQKSATALNGIDRPTPHQP